jgi:hypothetical protein
VWYFKGKIEEQKYHTVRTVQRSNRKIVERDKIDTHNRQIHDNLLSWLCTSIK